MRTLPSEFPMQKSFFKEELFDMDAFYPEYRYLHLCRQHLPWLGYEVSQAFQAIISVLSSPRILCPTAVLSFLRRVSSNWMVSSTFLVLVLFTNDTCSQQRRPLTEHGSKDIPGELRNRCKFTPISDHTKLVSSRYGGSHAWRDLVTHCRHVSPCIQSHS